MPKTRPLLPEDTKLDYAVVEGNPTISVSAVLTTRAQVNALLGQLAKLEALMPEARTRKPAGKKNGRVGRPRKTVLDVEPTVQGTA